MLAGELSQIYRAEVEVIPIVLTWDGIITKCGMFYRGNLGLDDNIKAYMQSIVLKKTAESMFGKTGKGYSKNYYGMGEVQEELISEMYQSSCNIDVVV